jgi:hypothetical protein
VLQFTLIQGWGQLVPTKLFAGLSAFQFGMVKTEAVGYQ